MIESRYENFLGTDQVHHAMGNHAMRNHVRRGPSVLDFFSSKVVHMYENIYSYTLTVGLPEI